MWCRLDSDKNSLYRRSSDVTYSVQMRENEMNCFGEIREVVVEPQQIKSHTPLWKRDMFTSHVQIQFEITIRTPFTIRNSQRKRIKDSLVKFFLQVFSTYDFLYVWSTFSTYELTYWWNQRELHFPLICYISFKF